MVQSIAGPASGVAAANPPPSNPPSVSNSSLLSNPVAPPQPAPGQVEPLRNQMKSESSSAWGLDMLKLENVFHIRTTPYRTAKEFVDQRGENVLYDPMLYEGIVGTGYEVHLDVYRKLWTIISESFKPVFVSKDRYEKNDQGASILVPTDCLSIGITRAINEFTSITAKTAMAAKYQSETAVDFVTPAPGATSAMLMNTTACATKMIGQSQSWLFMLESWVDVYSWVASRFFNLVAGIKLPDERIVEPGQFMSILDFSNRVTHHLYLCYVSRSYRDLQLAMFMHAIDLSMHAPESVSNQIYIELLKNMGYSLQFSTVGDTSQATTSGNSAIGMKILAYGAVSGLYQISFGTLAWTTLTVYQLWQLCVLISFVPPGLWDPREWANAVFLFALYSGAPLADISYPTLVIIPDSEFYPANSPWNSSYKIDLDFPHRPRCALFGPALTRQGDPIQRTIFTPVLSKTLTAPNCDFSVIDVLLKNASHLMSKKRTLTFQQTFSREETRSLENMIPPLLTAAKASYGQLSAMTMEVKRACFANTLHPLITANNANAVENMISGFYPGDAIIDVVKEFESPYVQPTMPAAAQRSAAERAMISYYKSLALSLGTKSKKTSSELEFASVIAASSSKVNRTLILMKPNDICALLQLSGERQVNRMPDPQTFMLRYGTLQNVDNALVVYSAARDAHMVLTTDLAGAPKIVLYGKKKDWRAYGTTLLPISQFIKTCPESLFNIITSGYAAEEFPVPVSQNVSYKLDNSELWTTAGYAPGIVWQSAFPPDTYTLSGPIATGKRDSNIVAYKQSDFQKDISTDINRGSLEFKMRKTAVAYTPSINDKLLVFPPISLSFNYLKDHEADRTIDFDTNGFAVVVKKGVAMIDEVAPMSYKSSMLSSFSIDPIQTYLIDDKVAKALVQKPDLPLIDKFVSIKKFTPIPPLQVVTILTY